MNKKELGQLIKEERESMDISRDELAFRLGVDRTTIWRWESGISTMSLNKWAELKDLKKDFEATEEG